MSGVLQRYLGRATGALQPNVRPRLPGRFETGGITEISEDVPVPAVPPALEEAGSETGIAAAPPPRLPGLPQTDTPVAPAPEAVPRAESGQGPPQPLLSPPAFPETHPAPARPMGETPPAAMPAPPATETDALTPRAASRMDDPLATPGGETARTARSDFPPPLPLLPERHGDRTVERTFREVYHQAAPAPEERSTASAPETTPPEITIHIGRLDIAAPAPPAKPAKKRRDPAHLTSLADYLAGRTS